MLNGTVYPEVNEIRSVRSLGQSWNALAVGAYNENALVEQNGILATGYKPVAIPGELCPLSTTSLQWRHSIALVKPEIVCPSGNIVGMNRDYSDCQDLSLLTTGADVASRPLDTVNATSATVAEAAYMAAELENAYPNLWPETVRGLLVHSARWSRAMIDRYSPKGSPEDMAAKGRRRLLRACGYGTTVTGKRFAATVSWVDWQHQYDGSFLACNVDARFLYDKIFPSRRLRAKVECPMYIERRKGIWRLTRSIRFFASEISSIAGGSPPR